MDGNIKKIKKIVPLQSEFKEKGPCLVVRGKKAAFHLGVTTVFGTA